MHRGAQRNIDEFKRSKPFEGKRHKKKEYHNKEVDGSPA